MNNLRRRAYFLIGFLLIFAGFANILSSFSGITGFIIAEDSTSAIKGLTGATLTLMGLAVLSLNRKKKKGQASMEFLMTYGWAILAAVMAISVLAYYGVFNPGQSMPDICTLSPPLGCEEYQITESGVRLVVRNGFGENILLSNVSIAGCTDNTVQRTLTVGQIETIYIRCPNTESKFYGDLKITYRPTSKTFSKRSEGSISGKVISSGIPSDYTSAWKFDNGLQDETGVMDATFGGDAAIISDLERGLVLNVDGDGDYVQVLDDESKLTITSNGFTVSMWVNPRAHAAGEYLEPIRKEGNGGFHISDDGYSNGYMFGVKNSIGSTIGVQVSHGEIPLDSWSHLGLVFDGTNVFAYVNGVLKGTSVATYGGGYVSNNGDMTIGSYDTGALGRFYNGMIDDVRIFHRELSAEEINLLYTDS